MKLSKLIYLGLLLFVFACNDSSKTTKESTHLNQKEYTFHYEDIANFRKVYEVAESKGDTLKAMKEYFANASEGMRGWIQRYNTKPETMVKAIKYMPKYYKSLLTIDDTLKQYEEEIIKGLNGIKELYPSDFVYLPPVYYFILIGGGGSVEMTANMMSVDYYGYHENIDKDEFKRVGGLFPEGSFPLEWTDQVPHVAVHETAHLLQSYIQGDFDYVSIYTDDKKRTMLAYAIREGGADYITYLGSGLKNKRVHSFGNSKEEELWKLFQPLLADDPNDHPGWFSGKSPNHPDWPWQIGYYLGFKMVEYYYETAEDKKEAMNIILSAYRVETFQMIAENYALKWSK